MSAFLGDRDRERERRRRTRTSAFDNMQGLDDITKEQIKRLAGTVVKDLTIPKQCPVGTHEENGVCVPDGHNSFDRYNWLQKDEPKHNTHNPDQFKSWDDIPNGQGVIDTDDNDDPENTKIRIHGKTLKKSEVKSFSFTIDNNIDPQTGIPRGHREIKFQIETTFGGRIDGSMRQNSMFNLHDPDPRKLLGMPTTEQILENNGLAPYKRATKAIDDMQKLEDRKKQHNHDSEYYQEYHPEFGLSDQIKKASMFQGFSTQTFTGTAKTIDYVPNYTDNIIKKQKKVKQYNITIGKRDENGDFDYKSGIKTFDPSILKKVARIPKSKQKKPKIDKPKPISKRKQKEIEKENKYKQPPIVY